MTCRSCGCQGHGVATPIPAPRRGPIPIPPPHREPDGRTEWIAEVKNALATWDALSLDMLIGMAAGELTTRVGPGSGPCVRG